ncbi:MAG: ISNCY family transposase [Candidatus Aenigmarchaeota archaeon]|nr:ISNCY family transposase [Candidatus Aenigmarchaeota archaeon]
MLKTKDIRQTLKDIEEYLLDEYKELHEEKKRNWRTYEQQLMKRIKDAVCNLKPLVDEAVAAIHVQRGQGAMPALSLQQKVTLLLMKQLFERSNRNMSSMLVAFSLLSGIDVSYKTIERLYADSEVELALHNLHVLILKRKGIKKVRGSGDGTGYALSISKHYASEAQKRRDKAKMQPQRKKSFVYAFKMLDLDSKMYVCYGMSMKSEKRAFDSAMKMLKRLDIAVESIRLDRYYSFPSYVDRFADARVYIIPRRNATVKGSWKWKRAMKRFVEDPLGCLEEYYQRNHSENGFSVDKRWFGWKVEQRREDRIETALVCQNIWHNLFYLYKD